MVLCILVIIGSGNNLLPDFTKLLHRLVLAIYQLDPQLDPFSIKFHHAKIAKFSL